MTKNAKTTVEMVNEAIDQADLEAVAKEEAARLGEEAAQLKEFTEKLTRDVERRVGEGIETFQRIAREAGDRLSASAASASEQAKKVYEESQTFVKANPTTTILGAFVVGILLGAIIRRK